MTIADEQFLKYSQDPFFCQDMIAFLCGSLIGQGQYRDVFKYNLDDKFVVKIQREAGNFNNIIEWEIWNNMRFTEHKKWFAECSWISGNGRIMLQRKTSPISKTKPPPERIPSFFTDIKNSNFGWIGNQFTAHDYDFTIVKLTSSGLTNKTKLWKTHSKET